MRKLLTALAVTSSILIGGAVAHAQTIAVATLPPGSLLNAQSQALAKVIQDHAGLRARVVSFSGDVNIYDALTRGEAEIAIDSIHVAVAARNGLEVFEGRPRPNVRVIARLFPFYSGIFVRRDSPITSIAQLRGQRMPVGYTAHAALISISQALLGTAGLTWNDIEGVPTVNVIRSGDDFAAGRIAGAPFGVGAPKVTEVAAAVGGVRFLPIPNTPEAAAAIRRFRPNDEIATLNPAPGLVGIEGPTPLMASDLTLVVGSHVTDAVVQQILRAVRENRAALAAGHPAFNAFDPSRMYKQFVMIDYHPGAVAFYRDNNIALTTGITQSN